MIIFFIRRFNDIDHIVPIIHKVALKDKNNFLVLCLNPDLAINKDYRIKYLKEKYEIKINHIYNVCNTSFKNRFLGLLACNKNKIQTYKWMGFIGWGFWLLSIIIRFSFGGIRYQKIFDNNFDLNWSKNLINKYNPSLLVFDWIKRYQHNASVIFDAAKERGIPLVSFPHGINFMTSTFHTNREQQQGFVNDESKLFSDFDYFVVSNNIEKEQRIARGIDKNKIVVLGSARFSKEWVKINNLITPSYLHADNSADKKLKVVFMEHSNHYRANEHEIIKSINKISSLEFIRLIIKPHTRSNKIFNKYSNVELVDKEVTSTELCKWADTVIVTMSSIAIEPLLKNKILLYPKYFHRNHTLWGDLGACWTINDQNELIEAMYTLKENLNFSPYSQDSVSNFLNKAIYNGDSSKDILSDYRDFLNNVANRDFT